MWFTNVTKRGAYQEIHSSKTGANHNCIQCFRWINTIRRVRSIAVTISHGVRLAHVTLHARHLVSLVIAKKVTRLRCNMKVKQQVQK